MFSELLQNVSEHYSKNLPFVVYRKPKETTVKAIFQQDSEVHYVNDFTETGFVFAPFDAQEPALLTAIDLFKSEDYITQNDSRNKKKDSLDDETIQKEFHIDLVERGIAHIRKGEFKKVVLSRKLETKFKASPIKLFQNLLDNYETAFCYFWHHPKIGTWLGATPEILLKVENKQFTTMSLAGTQKFVTDEVPQWEKKELEEQQLVTDYISATLQNSVANLNIGNRESVRAGNLWHLRTKLTGRIDKGSLAGIIKALHPTPAVCGMPMGATKRFILASENFNREYYTGFLGELNLKTEQQRTSSSKNQENKAYRAIKKKTTLFVNLRCMQLRQSIAQIYVGGGITQDSDAEREWQETVAKSKTMLKVLHTN